MSKKRFEIRNTGVVRWGIDLVGIDEQGNIENFDFNNPEDKYLHATMVDGEIAGNKFRQLMLFQKGIPGKNKCGEVNLTIREKENGECYVDVEEETIYSTPTETFKSMRAKRSSIDNEDPAVKRPAVSLGFVYLNSRRIGGPPEEIFYNVKKWSPQLAEQGKLMHVFDFIKDSYDAPGKVALIMALQHMHDDFFNKMCNSLRKPPMEDPRD